MWLIICFEDVWWSGVVVRKVPDLGTRWKWAVCLTSSLTPGLVPYQALTKSRRENIFTYLSVTRDEVSIGNWIYWTLQITTTVSLSYSKDHCNYSIHKVFSMFSDCCLVSASNIGRSPSSGFPNCPRPQLPASHFSQLELSTDSATAQSQCYFTTGGWPSARWVSRPEIFFIWILMVIVLM
jgi:hypothetical protein